MMKIKESNGANDPRVQQYVAIERLNGFLTIGKTATQRVFDIQVARGF
jgi:hypothetical protein